MEMRLSWLVVAALILGSTSPAGAKRRMKADLEVGPDPARAGEELAVTSSLTNNSDAVESVTVSLQMRGPCGVTASKGYKLLLSAHASDSSKSAFQAPPCPGGYTAVLTVSDGADGELLSTTTKTFEVVTKQTVARAK